MSTVKGFTKRVRRSAKPVNLTTAVDPKFLTLTGAPANEVAFKVVRNDGEKNMQHIPRRRVQRNDALVSVLFEEGCDETMVTAVMGEWGFTTFTIEQSGDRLKAILRADVATDTTMEVNIQGRTCQVLKPISNSTSDGKPAVSVARMDFAADAFTTVEEVKDWCKSNDIDTSNLTFTSTDLVTSVQRSDAKDAETLSIEVDSGVCFAVIRADVADIPVKFIEVISDTAFGQRGWGQLDFSAYLADREFTEASRDALYALESVLDRIQFYSDVPIPIRKDLVRSACNQYADYVIALMDALPSKVVVAIRSESTKEKTVTTAASKGQPAARTDDKKPDEQKPAVDNAAPITRGDVETMIAEANKATVATVATTVAEAVTAAFAAQRGEEKPKDGDKAPEAGKEGDAAQRSDKKPDAEPTMADVLRSMGELTAAVKQIKSDVDQIDGGTVVRSDGGDAKGKETGAPGKQDDVFRGIFGGRKA